MSKNSEELPRGIFLIGPPGIGKSTQGKLLGKEQGFYYLSSGELYRTVLDKMFSGRELDDARKTRDEGGIHRQEITFKLMDYALENMDYNSNHILVIDGIPRTLEQVEPLNERVNIEQIIYLHTNKYKKLITRISDRAENENRLDDKDGNTIIARIEEYYSKTIPVLCEYDQQIITKIDGMKPVDEIHNLILNQLRTNLL